MISLKNILTILAAGFFACKTPEQNTNAKIFAVEMKSLRTDTVITSAVYFDGHILCLQADHNLLVLDTLLNPDSNLTIKFSNLKADFLCSFNDSMLIGTDKDLYYLDKEFTLNRYNQKTFRYGLPYYNDDMYYVYACSAGEFGGAVFFWNKKTNKTYSYPATGVQQVFKFDDTFVVSDFLSHLSGFSDYLFIKDPTQLYELKDEKQKTFCNWYMEVDSIKNTNLNTVLPSGVKYYSDTFTTRTLTTFPYKNEIYSIYCTDSATILAKFQNSKLIPVDTLLQNGFQNGLIFHDARTHLAHDRIVTAYEATWGMAEDGNPFISYQNSGLIFIRNKKITFLGFQTPHMWKRNTKY